MNCPRRHTCLKSKRLYWERAPGWRAGEWGNPGGLLCHVARSLGFYSDGISFRVVFSQSFWLKSPSWWCMPCSAKMDASKKDSGRWSACGVSFWLFLNSSGWWRLITSMFLSRTFCRKTTHANGDHGAWPGWAVSISVLPLIVTVPELLQCIIYNVISNR